MVQYQQGLAAARVPNPLDTNRAAPRLVLAVSTLEKQRVTGGGPAYLKLGRRVLYAAADLDAWKAARRTHSTSQAVR